MSYRVLMLSIDISFQRLDRLFRCATEPPRRFLAKRGPYIDNHLYWVTSVRALVVVSGLISIRVARLIGAPWSALAGIFILDLIEIIIRFTAFSVSSLMHLRGSLSPG